MHRGLGAHLVVHEALRAEGRMIPLRDGPNAQSHTDTPTRMRFRCPLWDDGHWSRHTRSSTRLDVGRGAAVGTSARQHHDYGPALSGRAVSDGLLGARIQGRSRPLQQSPARSSCTEKGAALARTGLADRYELALPGVLQRSSGSVHHRCAPLQQRRPFCSPSLSAAAVAAALPLYKR